MFAPMTTREFYRFFLNQLSGMYDTGEATVMTDWVFESMASIGRTDLLKDPGGIDDNTIKKLNNALEQLLKHKPLQYVTGEAWFYKMKLKVNEQVLIPRPETEELVQWLIDENQTVNNKRKLSILDIGTGSGCIAIAIKKNLPGAAVTAIDNSQGALTVAKENSSSQQAGIEFLQVDFLDESQWGPLPVFDMIISNPPYIPLNEKEKLDKNVSAYEPHNALFVPNRSPLLFYEKIAAFGKKYLAEKGKIYVETHEGFAKETAAVFAGNYQHVTIRNDIFGKERMLSAIKV